MDFTKNLQMNLNLSNLIKIVLAVLFFLCLADMPYGFYQFVRFAGLIGFAIIAYQAHEQGRQMWNIVDVVVGVGLLISIFMKPKESPR